MESKEITDYLQYKITILRDVSLQLKSKIDTAKTEYKRKFYKKKLKFNNEYLAKVLIVNAKSQMANEINEKHITK